MSIGRIGAALLLAVWLAPRLAPGVAAFQEQGPAVLDVPFVVQSELLCGGAAAAMVLRYWGAREIYAEDFAPLLEPGDRGIRGDAVAAAVRGRGWKATPFRGDRTSVHDHLAAGRPVIALIEEAPGRYHYVVLLGWANGRVTLHDSARAPFRVLAESDFARRWATTDSWTLLILPDPESRASAGETSVRPRAEPAAALAPRTDQCDALVAEGVRMARAGDQASADRALSEAVSRCPSSALAARELAGLRFVQSRWQDAAQLAARATEAAPDDPHAWRLLASSRFIQDDVDGALHAWNRVGEPRIDLVQVNGLERTHHTVVGSLLDLTPRTPLTASRLRQARRRLALLPAASATRLDYRPLPGGLAEIDVAVVEWPAFPGGAALAAVAARALTDREARVDFSTPAGRATRWIAAWRWWEARPRVGLSLLAPAAFGRSGLWRLDGFWERQAYAIGPQASSSVVRDDRKRLGLSYSDWMAADTRIGLGIAFDRWSRSARYVATFGSLDQRFAGDRIAARVDGSLWASPAQPGWFGTGGFRLAWRSSAPSDLEPPPLLTARAGLAAASVRAPFDVWPGAGVGHARELLARAHPLLDGGVVSVGIFGRTLAHGGAELRAGTLARGPVRMSLAVFGDLARPWHTLESGSGPAEAGHDVRGPRTHIDVGIGLRLQMPGQAQTLRIDVAHGLRDGRRAISAGWQLPWPD
jgi:hypothetical protein